MIDEKALVNKLTDMILPLDGFYAEIWSAGAIDSYNNLIREIIKLVHNQPKINEWTSVSDKPPSVSGDYLVAYVDDDVGISAYDDMYESFGYYDFDDEFWRDNDVVAWMPLPTYKTKNEE